MGGLQWMIKALMRRVTFLFIFRTLCERKVSHRSPNRAPERQMMITFFPPVLFCYFIDSLLSKRVGGAKTCSTVWAVSW